MGYGLKVCEPGGSLIIPQKMGKILKAEQIELSDYLNRDNTYGANIFLNDVYPL